MRQPWTLFEVEGLFVSQTMEERISHWETVGNSDRPDSPAVEQFGPCAPCTTSGRMLSFPLVSVLPFAHFLRRRTSLEIIILSKFCMVALRVVNDNEHNDQPSRGLLSQRRHIQHSCLHLQKSICVLLSSHPEWLPPWNNMAYQTAWEPAKEPCSMPLVSQQLFLQWGGQPLLLCKDSKIRGPVVKMWFFKWLQFHFWVF